MLDRDVLESRLDQLAAGNKIARKWSMSILGPRRRGVFHQVLRSPSQAARLKVKPEELAQIKNIPVEDRNAIALTWEIAADLWEHYKKLVYRLAHRFCVKVNGASDESLPDLIGEATVAFLKAVRGYDSRDNGFSAYFGQSVLTELRRYVKRSRGLAGANESLLIAYRQKWQELAVAGQPCDFDSIAQALELSPKKRAALWGTLQEPTGEGDLAENLSNMVVDKSAKKVDEDLIKAIGMVELSVLERDAWITRDAVKGLFPSSNKNMREVAQAHECSPQAAAYAAERANEKIVRKLKTMGYS